MSIKYKLITSLCLFTFFIFFLLFLIYLAIIHPGNLQLEKEEATKRVNLCMSIIQNEIQTTDELCKKLSTWNYLKTLVTGIKDATLDNSLQQLTNMKFLILCSPSDEIITEIEIPDEKDTVDKQAISNQTDLLHTFIKQFNQSQEKDLAGLYATSEEIILFSSKPVKTGKDNSAASERLVIGTYIDSDFLKKIRKLSQLDLEITPIETQNKNLIPGNNANSFITFQEKQKSLLAVTKIIPDFKNQPSLRLQLTFPRDVYQHSNASFEYLSIVFGLGSIIAIFFFYFFLHQNISIPVQRIISEIKSIKERNSISNRLSSCNGNRRNEFSVLSDHFNQFLDELSLSQAALYLQKERYQRLVENLKDEYIFYSINKQGLFQYISPSIESVGGYKPEDILGKSINFFFREDNQSEASQRWQRLINGERLPLKEYPFKNSNGDTIYLEFLSIPTLDATGQVIGIEGIARNTTQRKQMEKVLQESEERFRTIVEASQDAMIEINSDRQITIFNPAAEKMFKHNREEMIGQTLDAILPMEYKEIHKEYLRNYFESQTPNRAIGMTVELPALRKNGDVFPVDLSLSACHSDDKSKSFVVAIIRDITERKRTEEKLREALKAAEAATVTKSQFLANMSHEIRTPISGIMGTNELLYNTHMDDKQRKYVNVIRQSAKLLLTIINDILDFSKIEAGRLELESIGFDLRTVLENVQEIFYAKAESKGLKLHLHYTNDIPEVLCGDPIRIQQIVNNLINNAIKFTEKGEISLRTKLLYEDDNVVTIYVSVQDTGIGIPEDRSHSLFQFFSQVDSSTSRKFGGTGLGLAISKNLVELMNGKIGVESHSGKGSTFWFTITLSKQNSLTIKEEKMTPLRNTYILVVDSDFHQQQIMKDMLESWECNVMQAMTGNEALTILRHELREKAPIAIALIDSQLSDMDGEILGQTIKNESLLHDTALILITSFGIQGDAVRAKEVGFSAYLTRPIKHSILHDCLVNLLQPSSEEGTASQDFVTLHSLEADRNKSHIRILVAEDDETLEMITMEFLSEMGYSAESAPNGKMAMEKHLKNPYHIILMDCQMPEMDGYTATGEIRLNEGEEKHTPIIAMTAHSLKGEKERCLAAGMDDYISKPFNFSILSEMLKKYTGNWKSLPVSQEQMEEQDIFDKNAALAQFDHKERILLRTIQKFLFSYPEYFKQITQAIEDKNHEEIRRLAHSIKGASGFIYANRIRETSFQLQFAGENKNMDQAQILLKKLDAHFMEFKQIVSSTLEFSNISAT